MSNECSQFIPERGIKNEEMRAFTTVTAIECGECNMCDLEPGKICDNCMRCVESGFDYNEVVVDDIIVDDNNALPTKPATDKAALKAAWRE
jgi:hypothetical protein